MKIGSPAWQALLETGAAVLESNLDQRRIGQFARYAEELCRWNRRMNLTAITDPEALAVKHFLDSIAPAAMIPPAASLLDIGSGAGFPGIPLKILRPSLKVTLIDAVRKKVNFQKHIIRTLGLEEIQAHHVRAEEFGAEKPFDVVIARALSSVVQFVGLALPLLARDGLMLALKGLPGDAQAEAAALQQSALPEASGSGGSRLRVTLSPYRLPGIAARRTIVAVRRMSSLDSPH